MGPDRLENGYNVTLVTHVSSTSRSPTGSGDLSDLLVSSLLSLFGSRSVQSLCPTPPMTEGQRHISRHRGSYPC